MKLWFERGAWASARGRRVLTAMAPESVRRIAVVRHAALGDMVLVRPFLIEARRFFPNAEIVLSLVSNYTYGAPTDLVDAVHVVHGSDQKQVSARERMAQAKALGPVDLLFDLADTTRSRYLCLLAQAQARIGFPYRWYLRNLLLEAAVPRSDYAFEAVNMLDALMLLGANPRFPLDYGWPTSLVGTGPDPAAPPCVVYFPFASVDSKCWPAAEYQALIALAAAQAPQVSHCVLAGVGAHEQLVSYQPLADRFSNVVLQPSLPLDETIRLLRRSALVVSNDTGVRNLAMALGTPTLGIFFSTVPYRYWPREGGHQAVFRADGQVPSVADVWARLGQAMDGFR
jgi:ADP-heptose:LPS heptosyltransferase